MAADFNKPVSGDAYATVLQMICDNSAALAVMLNPSVAVAASAANIPTDAIRYNGASGKFEKWGGSAWAELTLAFLKTDGSNSMSGLLTAAGGIDVTASGLRMRTGNTIRFDDEAGANKWLLGQDPASTNNNLLIYDVARSASILSVDATNGLVTITPAVTIAGAVTGGSFASAGWFSSTGSTGWKNDTYGGGIYMTDTDYVRAFNSKGLYAEVFGANRYAGAFRADDNRWFGKVVQIATNDAAGTDGPQIHFVHYGVAEWGFGMEDGNGTGLVMYAGGNTIGWGPKRFGFGYDGTLTLYSASPMIVFADSDNAQRAVHCNSNLIGFLSNGGSWTLYSDNNGDLYMPGGRFFVLSGSLSNVNSGSWGGQVEIRNGGGTGACKITFHRQSAYALEAGLDSDNVWRVGGGSDGANYRYQIDGSGNLTTRGSITGTVVTQTSDERLKSGIRRITVDPAKVFGLADAAHTFRWKASGKKDAGFIAQDLQRAEPMAVYERDDGYLTINIVPVVAHLAVHAADIERRLQRLEAAA